MRVVGGTWRGRPLEAPQGRGTRPSTDRNREALASMVLSAEGLTLEGRSVLDAFAGSGAVGIELLSRGAASCTFVDSDRRALACIRRNLASLGIPRSQGRAVAGDLRHVLASHEVPGTPFDVVFLDPPYAMAAEDVSRIVADAWHRGAIASGALVVYERSSEAPGLVVDGARVLRTRGHGITSFDLLRLGKAGED